MKFYNTDDTTDAKYRQGMDCEGDLENIVWISSKTNLSLDTEPFLRVLFRLLDQSPNSHRQVVSGVARHFSQKLSLGE
jgi:hypothetical protein